MVLTEMKPPQISVEAPHESKIRLLNSALDVIRAKGYAGTTVDDICHKAGITKGSFFHHFKSKDELALAASAYWASLTEGFFEFVDSDCSRRSSERNLAADALSC